MLVTPRQRLRRLIADVAHQHNLQYRDVVGHRHIPRVVAARRAAISAIAADSPQLSSPQIGALFRKHHTTILNALGRTARSRK